jgi:hypothetical protein
MSEITDYGELDGYTIAEIFGNEMIYNDLKLYVNRMGVHVKVYRNANKETKKQRVEVYFDGKLVLDEYYSQYHSCDMFYYLNQLETEMEADGIMECFYICRHCNACYSDGEVDCMECDNTACVYLHQAETFEKALENANK